MGQHGLEWGLGGMSPVYEYVEHLAHIFKLCRNAEVETAICDY